MSAIGSPAPSDRLRIDKWLWHARLAKTRGAAQKLAVSGRVRVNRERSDSASRPVRPGDVLTVALEAGVRVLRIVALGTRRGPASEARLLYDDLAPPAAASPSGETAPAATGGAGRPDKRDRRALAALKRQPGDDFPPDGT